MKNVGYLGSRLARTGVRLSRAESDICSACLSDREKQPPAPQRMRLTRSQMYLSSWQAGLASWRSVSAGVWAEGPCPQ